MTSARPSLLAELYDAHCVRRFPKLGVELGGFLVYDAAIAGLASRASRGERFSATELPTPDGDTMNTIDQLSASTELSVDEAELLEYFNQLARLRYAILQG